MYNINLNYGLINKLFTEKKLILSNSRWRFCTDNKKYLIWEICHKFKHSYIL